MTNPADKSTGTTKGNSYEPHYLSCRPRRHRTVYFGLLRPEMMNTKRFATLRRHFVPTAVISILLGATLAQAEQVGNVDVDFLGNDIVIEAFADPKVEGVTCHVAYFERGLIDRLQKGDWFEDPSNSSISCRQTGEITLGDIDRSDEGESVFSERRSVVWKSLRVKRIFDSKNKTLIYISHARDVQNGSAKMSISTIPLFQRP
jgi:CreA protein